MKLKFCFLDKFFPIPYKFHILYRLQKFFQKLSNKNSFFLCGKKLNNDLKKSLCFLLDPNKEGNRNTLDLSKKTKNVINLLTIFTSNLNLSKIIIKYTIGVNFILPGLIELIFDLNGLEYFEYRFLLQLNFKIWRKQIQIPSFF